MAVQARFDLPPENAIAFFRDKGLLASYSWKDVWAQEHELAFTVAKMADVDLLADVRDAVDQAIAEGQTLQDFKKAITPKLVKAGWWGTQEQIDPLTGKTELVQLGSPRRLKTIFETNMHTAYAAGEWEQIEEASVDAPYLMYDAVDDNRTRPQHHAWSGTVLRWDDPWWDTHRPPNGYNCRCSTIQLSKYDLRGMGKDGPDQAPAIKRRKWVNSRTGEEMEIPVGIDPGFDYNPGAKRGQRQAELDGLLASKRQALQGEPS
ncbi:phage minor head protein [Pseudoxanthomonas winnipegensis]|uniref:phage head morphogenesis protein n=1 Tax=Pseudoxanthomonas winnipegensis TaxID=2480810 RepID=UPI00103E65FF|nr:phage minor head protein [Pseudoxanthomonas winnipegensis]TBV76869.1 hypothetical protein EYC45_01505 [Pseudoxanthomonas winnipegensis]